MARKAIVDKEIILNMLRMGESTRSVAERFGVSRQAIDLHRRDFINKGLLTNQRAVKKRRAAKEDLPTNRKLVSSKESVALENNIIPLDTQINLIIDAFSALKSLPQLERELVNYKRKYESAMQELDRLKQVGKKRYDQEQRWLLVQRQNDINTSLKNNGEAGEN
ncbi:hypothetical protein ACFLVX_02510 [Chloroflexota bacterium]